MSASASLAGFGLGLRPEHYRDFTERRPGVDWVEILSENYLVPGGKALHFLDRIRADYPMAMHGVSLSIAGSDPLDEEYLRALKRLAQRVQPAVISDHLCWTGVDGRQLHDLLPVPFTVEALRHVEARVGRVQDYLGRTLLLENVSSYLAYAGDDMTEAQFLAELVRRSGCGLLLDVNNVYVSAMNQGFEPMTFLEALPPPAVRQIHLAGHSERDGTLIDTHDAPVCDAVWSLFRQAIGRFGLVPSMIERDDNIPALAELLAELDSVRRHARNALAKGAPRALAA